MKISALVLAVLILAMPFSADAATKKTNITCEVTASTKVVKKGETVTISWKGSHSIITYGPDGSTIAPAGSMEVTPTQRTIYKFKFIGIGGNEKCGVRVRIAGETVAP